MNNAKYRKIIENWTNFVNNEGVTFSDGKPITVGFWKTFLGLSRSVHVEILNDSYKRKAFSPLLTQTVRFANRLPQEHFLQEVRLSVTKYEKEKRK